MISVSSKNQVILLPILGEIFLGIVNHMIGPKRARLLQIPRAAHGSDFSAERFGYLHRKRSHPTRCPIDQNLLPRMNLSFIAQTLQGSEGSHWYSRCFLKR